MTGRSPLPTFPDDTGMNDGFCSDRHGHVYTSNSDGSGGVVWMFNTDTGAWQQVPSVPFDIGDSGSCSISGDGDLYFVGFDAMARLKVF